MYRFLLSLCALDNLLMVPAHIAFWKSMNWAEELARLSAINRGTMQVLNNVVIYVFCWAAGITLYYAWTLPRGRMPALVLLFIGGIFIVRLAAEYPCYGWSASGPQVVVLCLASAAFHLPAAYYALRGGRPDMGSQHLEPGDKANCTGEVRHV